MRNYYFFAIVVFLFSCNTIKKVSTTEALKKDADQKLTTSTVDMNEIKGHIYYLASDEMKGRDTPSPEQDIAARYLATSLMKYGVKPPAGQEDYLQKVPMKTVTPATSGTLAFGTYNFSLPNDFLLLEGGNVDVNGSVVFLDRGTEKDFAATDVKDKIVVTFCGFEGQDNPQEWFYTGRQKMKWAKEKGAKAHIEIYTSTQIPFNFLARYFTGKSTMLDDSEGDENFPYLWMNAGNKEAVAAIKNTADIPVNVKVEGLVIEKMMTHNVVGVVEGSDPVLKNEYIIYSAHYDHVGIGAVMEGDSIYNGARDNAVGSVTVLSAAENIAKYPTKRSAIFIFFTGEEKGLLGSSYYAENPIIPLNKVTYCFNSDNAGYNDTSVATIIGLERTDASNLIEKACTTFGLTAIKDNMPEQGLFDRSDNVNFAKKGVPAPTFSLGITAFDDEINRYYHQAADGPNTLDYPYLFKFFKSYVYACRLIGNTSQSLFWKEGDKYYEAGKELYGK